MELNQKIIQKMIEIDDLLSAQKQFEDELMDKIKKEAEQAHIRFEYMIFSDYHILMAIPKIHGYSLIENEAGEIVFHESNRDKMYNILEKYNYNVNSDIKIVMQNLLTYHNISDELIYDCIKKSVNHNSSPYDNRGYKTIKNIEYKSPYFYITDCDDYMYRLIDLKKYDMKSDKLNIHKINEAVQKGGKKQCHQYAEMIANLLPEGETITSICSRFIKGNYYLHSYTEYNGYIIDLTFNTIIPKEDYYRLMQPVEVFKCKNSELSKNQLNINSMLEGLQDYEKIEKYLPLVKLAYFNLAMNPDFINNNINQTTKKIILP